MSKPSEVSLRRESPAWRSLDSSRGSVRGRDGGRDRFGRRSRQHPAAPADDPGWSNVERSKTNRHLGDRWVLTAGHSGGRELRLGNRLFQAVQGKIRHGIATAPGTEADLQLFQLRESPELPRLRLASSAPRAETQVVMIGSGLDRSPSRAMERFRDRPARLAWYAGLPGCPGRAMRWEPIASPRPPRRDGEAVSCAATVFDGGLPFARGAAIKGDLAERFAKNGDGPSCRHHDHRPCTGISLSPHHLRQRELRLDPRVPRADRETSLLADHDGDDPRRATTARGSGPEQADADRDGTGDSVRSQKAEGQSAQGGS
jgi:hypothetical protein